MTHRLATHWVVLHKDMGINPHRAHGWTLDEALLAEEYVERMARERRVAAVRRRG